MAVFVQRRTPPITAGLIGLTLALSFVVAIDAGMGGQLYYHLALLPEGVWHGQLWRLVTWPFIQGGPLRLIFACVALYTFGSDLLLTWGPARYLRYLAVVALIAGVGTCLVALVLPSAWWLPRLGGTVVGDALVIAWARQFPDHPVSIYALLLLKGRALVSIVIAGTIVFGVYYGLAWVLPELLAIAAALLYTSRSARRWWLELRLRQVRGKLRVVR